MRLRIVWPLLLVLALAAHAGAQEPVGGPGLRLTAAELLAGPRQGPRLGLAPLPVDYRLPIPAWSRSTAWTVARPGRLARATPRLPWPDGRLVPRRGEPPTPVAADTAERGGVFPELELPAVVQELADLTLLVEGRGELGGSWNQYRPCEPELDLNCKPDLLPRLRPDIQFGIQVGGSITDRIHVDVDYDQRREFDAANNINVYYQGAPGELLQRVEMGDVSIDLPASRYLTQGIPAGNFGFKTTAQVGITTVEALWAQQKGDIATREFRLGGTGQEGLVQDQELVLDDASYASGQFFFLVDPERLSGWPNVDVLTLDHTDAPAAVRPRADRLAVYRDEGVTLQRYTDQAQTGSFLADAVSDDGDLRHSGLFTLLEPGQDYYIHSSGLWIALRAPLRDDEALAVAYLSETGVPVGDPEAEATPTGETPELRLVRGPVTIHQPGQPTWLWEMHQVYRLDSSARVDPSTLDLTISLGHAAGGVTFKERAGEPISLLRLFGLDDDAPADRIDEAHLFRPGAEFEGPGPSAIRGTFIVFPTAEPFADPPPVPSEGLSAVEARLILGNDANPAIYREPDPVVRGSSSRFRLNFRYRVRLEGLLSSFNLGAFGIRPGSERITVDDRLLVRGVDYVVDYDLGLVTLLDPEAILGGNPDAELRASWEQESLFDVTPTTVFGLNAATPIGAYGDINLMGLYQSEQAVVRRPQLGSEPGAVLLGGASGRLAFQADWLSRFMDAIPGLTVDSIAQLDVAGELAVSAPEPNRQGATYLDDFEATDELALILDDAEWQLGSAPQDGTAVPMNVWPMTQENAADLVWQDRYRVGDEEVGFLTPNQIDQQIAVAGARLAEPVLYLTLGGRNTEAPQWRSLTTVLSTTGQDLSRSEYLEFYAAALSGASEGMTLIVDIGTVSEDAFYVDSTGALNGVSRFGESWGQDILDAEAELARREVWGPDQDARGLWGQTCVAERLSAVPLGDDRANCTVLNGRPDTEDLNANGVLDALDGPSYRYVIPLGPGSPYIVRGQAGTATDFRLFRIPLRGPAAVPLNGATEATWRFIKHVRITTVKPAVGRGTLGLARVRITGSRWTKRDLSGILSGRTGDSPGTGSVTGRVRVGPVSQLTEGEDYSSPPGIADQVQDPKTTVGATGVEFNEKSLRLSWEQVPGNERAEVYYRYPQQPRNFLEYRQIRFWAIAREGDWGLLGSNELLFKLGTDPRNFYVYRTWLNPVAGARVDPEDWRPEHVIEVEKWLELKAEAERRLVEESGPLVIWSSDGRYGIVLEDRARAPNLAAVRELGLAVYNFGDQASDGEVWINDLRLDAGSSELGYAGRVDVDLNAGGVVTANVSVGGRGGRFRQLEGMPTYETVADMTVNATAELGRFAPSAWGVSMPVTMTYLRTDNDPVFLRGTDIRAERLPGLRDSGMSRRRVGVALRKTTPSSNPLVSALVDGTVIRAGHVRSTDKTVTTASELDGFDGEIAVDRRVAEVSVPIVPGFVRSLLRWLAPARIEESAFFDRVAGARLRLTPERIGLSTSYLSQQARVWRYDRVLESPRDLDVQAIESPRRLLESGARLSLRPLESLTAQIGVRSGRDVLEPERATPLALEQQAMRRARDDIAGLPVGWERDRAVSSDFSFRPAIADWLRPSVVWSSRFRQRRDPSHIAVVATGDTVVADLERTFNTNRRFSRSVMVDVAGAIRAAAAPPEVDPAGWLSRSAVAAVSPLKPVELTWVDELGSRFDRELAVPGLDYQLGLGQVGGFRVVDDDTATFTLVRDGFRVRSGLRLGAAASLDVAFNEMDSRIFDLRAGPRTQDERSWPDVRFSWTGGPVPDWAAGYLETWSVSTGYVRTSRALRLGDEFVRVRSQLEETVPLELRVEFAGVSLSWIASVTEGEGEDPTGFTRQHAMTQAVAVSGRMASPAVLRQTIPEPLRISFSYDYQEQTQSRVIASRLGLEDFTPFIDHVNRRVNLTISSLISRMDVGLQASYVDRRSYIGTRAGSSQFQLGLFGQFTMNAGT